MCNPYLSDVGLGEQACPCWCGECTEYSGRMEEDGCFLPTSSSTFIAVVVKPVFEGIGEESWTKRQRYIAFML